MRICDTSTSYMKALESHVLVHYNLFTGMFHCAHIMSKLVQLQLEADDNRNIFNYPESR